MAESTLIQGKGGDFWVELEGTFRNKKEGNTRVNASVPSRCLSGVLEGGVTITVKLCH